MTRPLFLSIALILFAPLAFAEVDCDSLELVALAAKDDSRAVHSDSMKADPDPVVQKKYSEGLLFRAIVNGNIRRHISGAKR